MGKHSKRKKNRKQLESLSIAAQKLAQLYKSLDVEAVQTWCADYFDRHGDHLAHRLVEYVMQHYPDEYELYYTQIILPETLRQHNLKPEDVSITRFVDETGRRKVLIAKK